jgi:cytochrome c biogenesis protein CcmG/thiol:disulfide interchange protein DsbE
VSLQDEKIDPPAPGAWPFNPFVLLPLVIFVGLVVLFSGRLFSGDPAKLPSTLIGKPVPAFALPPVEGMANQAGLGDADLRQGRVTLVNMFASWCVPCHQEHAILMQLAQDQALKEAGLRIVGIAYKDAPDKLRGFLDQNGDPYAQVGADRAGRTAIDFGVYGVPETFIVKGDGTIAYKFIGPMSEESLRDTILPEIAKAAK